jgi:hypothetical protein
VKRLPARRPQVPTNRCRPPPTPTPPASARVIVAKKRKSGTPGPDVNLPVVAAHAIPISEHTSQVMPGQLDINKRFDWVHLGTLGTRGSDSELATTQPYLTRQPALGWTFKAFELKRWSCYFMSCDSTGMQQGRLPHVMVPAEQTVCSGLCFMRDPKSRL